MGLKGVFKFFFRRGLEILIIILIVLFLPNLPPHVKIEKPYTVTAPKPLEGKLSINEKLNYVEIWHKGDLHGPEAFADFNGELYTTLNGGDIVKLTGEHITPIVKFGKPCKGSYEEKICGRPLGMSFKNDGSLIVCDAYYGIFEVDVKTGDKVKLISVDTEINGKKMKLPNSVAVASNGDIYWSDSSTEFYLEDGVFDILSDGSGRLVHYNTKTKQNKVLLDGLLFANGVALSQDEEFVVVSETGKGRLHRCFLKGTKQSKCEVFVDGLPGLPDNLKADGRGGFFVPLFTSVDKDHPTISQVLGPFPLIRRLVVRILGIIEHSFKLVDRIYPNEYAKKAIHFIGHFHSFSFAYSKHRFTLVHISKTGEVIDSFHATNGLTAISEAHIFKGYLYLGSPFNDYIARIPLSKIGLDYLEKPLYPSTSGQTQPPITEQTQSPPVKQTQPPTTKQTQPPTVKQTEPPTIKQTQPPTTKQTQPPTAKQTQPPTTKETQPPTTKETQPPTTKETQPPTTKQTQPPTKQTQPPTTKQTQPPTTKQTQPPTTKQTQPPTTKPTESPTSKQSAQPTTTEAPKIGQNPSGATTSTTQAPPSTKQTQPPSTAEKPSPPNPASQKPPVAPKIIPQKVDVKEAEGKEIPLKMDKTVPSADKNIESDKEIPSTIKKAAPSKKESHPKQEDLKAQPKPVPTSSQPEVIKDSSKGTK